MSEAAQALERRLLARGQTDLFQREQIAPLLVLCDADYRVVRLALQASDQNGCRGNLRIVDGLQHVEGTWLQTWFQQVAFVKQPELLVWVANREGYRAASVSSLYQAHRALRSLRPNLLVIEMPGRTYYECREFIRLMSEQH